MISNYYLLDGTPTRNLYGTNSIFPNRYRPGRRGIKEFRLITDIMPAEYGMSMGSEMVVVSKSGTNQLHGDAFEYLRNSSLDARNFFDQQPSALGNAFRHFDGTSSVALSEGRSKKTRPFSTRLMNRCISAWG